MKTLVVALLAAISLAGCVVAPAYPDAGYYGGYYGPGYYYGPSVGIYYGHGYYRHHHWH
jgi:hypothetical protein